MDSSKKWRQEMARAGKVAVTVYIDQDLRNALNDVGKARRWTMTEAYEHAIQAFLDTLQEPSQSLFDALQEHAEETAPDDHLEARLEAVEKSVFKIDDLSAQISNILKSIDILNTNRLSSPPILETPQEHTAPLQEPLQEPSKDVEEPEKTEESRPLDDDLVEAVRALKGQIKSTKGKMPGRERKILRPILKGFLDQGYDSDTIAKALNDAGIRPVSADLTKEWKNQGVTTMTKAAK